MTSWGVKYRCQHTDLIGNIWVVDLLLENYAGAIEEAKAGGVPIEISTLGEGDELGGLKPKEWVVEFINLNPDTFQYLPIFTGTARDYMAKIYKNGTLIGTGFCDPDNYSEDFISEPYPSKIHVHDGLGELKNIYYSMPDNPFGQYHRPIIGYIGEALSTTGLELPLYVASDITFKKKTGTEITSQAFEQLYIDWRVFRLGEDKWWSYHEILTYIIGAFQGMRIYQEAGAWWIDRAGPMKAASYTVYKYSAGEDPEYIGSETKNPVQALTSNKIDTSLVCRFGSQAQLTIMPAWKRFTIEHDYGKRENFLKSQSFLGTFFPDEWRTDEDLWFWTRFENNISLIKNEDGSFTIPGYVHDETLYPPYVNFLQSDTVYVSGNDLLKLRESWGDSPLFSGKGFNIGMKLSVNYFLRASGYFASQEKIRFFLRVSIIDDDGKVWNTMNTFDDPDTGEHMVEEDLAWFDPEGTDPAAIIEVIPRINEWSAVEFKIPNCALRGDEAGLTQWGFFVKIYQATSTLGTGDLEKGDGLVISGVKLSFYDRGDEEHKRTIVTEVNKKNRVVPSNIEVRFGESPGHWGKDAPHTGQEWMDKHIFLDADGDPVTIFSIASSELGTGGLIEGVMTSDLTLQRKLPLLKLRGSVRDNPNNVDFCTTLQDYVGNFYCPTGMSRDAGMAEVQAEWVQLRQPEQETGGEFNWDFSNDLNI